MPPFFLPTRVDLGLLHVPSSIYTGEPWPCYVLNQPLAVQVVDMAQHYYVTFLVDWELLANCYVVATTSLTHSYRELVATLIILFILSPQTTLIY